MNVRKLSCALQKKAIEELNEVPSRVPTDIATIREWILKQPYLNARTDDQWLLAFLRCSKFSLERTKTKLDNYYTIKTLLPEYFQNRDPMGKDIQNLLNIGLMNPLPRTQEDVGPRIILCRWENCDKSISMDHLIKAFFMLLDILLLEDDNFVISGTLIWVNFHLFPMHLLLQMTPTLVKKFFTLLQKAYPARTNAIHYTNTPSAFELIFNLTMSIATPKLKNRMLLHSTENMKNFYKYLPIEYLPKEYGGENSTLDKINVEWKQKLEDYREWFLEDEKYGLNEKLRPSKAMTYADVFGVEGSFRKLTVD